MVKHRNIVETLEPYRPGKPISEVKRELGLTDVIKLASNENPLGCSPKAVEALIKWTQEASLYPDGNCTELRNALAKRFNLEPEQFLFGAGSDEILEMIAQTYINPGDTTITCWPSFSRYEAVTRIMDGTMIKVPLRKDYRFDLEGILKSITVNTRIIWLCNPNNPTGTIITAKEQKAFLEKVPREVLVVLDEAYYEYAHGRDYPESIELLEEYDNIIILRTFSKAYGLAGLRIGYAISHKETIELLNRVRGPFNVNAAAQAAALAALDDQEFVQRSVQTNEKGKRYLYQAFEEMGLEYIPTHTNFIMVNVEKNSADVFKALLQKGVIIRAGDIFDMDNWIRVTIGTPEQNRRFIEALKEVLG
ncbi:histidinol-phosphate aminotransferase [Caldicoprobacter guelmensis]|uniref:histidinol-phosphate transaminase n=1 Tax=Caldicoprobacter guelmensis TaxID=1170224 RepID=UPI00195E1EB6|nr:histidinol-phosphate transaminase [Caldicoprobacter guelmensis]MBM7581700.1 histidinol-phosphate aminotransferase [Caldicoprobacter guelmensis]